MNTFTSKLEVLKKQILIAYSNFNSARGLVWFFTRNCTAAYVLMTFV